MIKFDENNKYVLSGNYNVSMSEIDRCQMVKPAALLNFMQDLAAKSINRIDGNLSCDSLLEKGLGWFLIRYRIEFDDYPIGVEAVKVLTECRGVNRMTTYRDFEVYDLKSDKRLLRAVTSWFLVDLKSKSIANILQNSPDFIMFEKREDDLSLQKIRPISEPDNEKMFHVRYDDLDMNGHVNNTVYITWAMEALDFDFRASHKLKSLDIYFKHEVKYGDDILSTVKMDKENLTSTHLITDSKTGIEVCLLKAQYIAI